MSQIKENTGISLIKKGKKGIISIIFSRLGLIVALLLLQIVCLLCIFRMTEEVLPHIYGGSMIFTTIMVLYLLSSPIDPTAKITWLVVIVMLPVFGALLYLYVQSDIGHRALKNRLSTLKAEARGRIPQSTQVMEALKEQNPGVAALARYITRSGCYPVFRNSEVTYFPIGEAKFREMLRQLEKAKQFIFLEYFIVAEGLMWGRVLEILARKAREGVEIRLMYDGTCEFTTLPHNYPQQLQELGIQCKMFAPLAPFVSTHYNYRDHRKILVIDGHTAFTGGVNLADEYINRIDRFGHWKDAAVMIQGEAVRSFTLMFLQLWALDEPQPVFEPYVSAPSFPQQQAHGFVIPYSDCPLDEDKVGERVYMDILNRARRYVHIMTPYLILDGEMETALKFAAERGVDVRLILPGIPDKKIPYALAMTHYNSLLASGVKIFEYTPGFVHSKVFVCDDCEAVVGTINLDYRSLYHHFECAAYLCRTDCIADIEADFRKTVQKCRRVRRTGFTPDNWKRKSVGFLVKVIAPLL